MAIYYQRGDPSPDGSQPLKKIGIRKALEMNKKLGSTTVREVANQQANQLNCQSIQRAKS